MAPKRRAYVAAMRLSDLPELQELLAPFLGGKGPRGQVVMVRLGDEAAARLNDLVEAGLFGSRSEAAAFLIGAGIQAQHDLFDRIATRTSEIKKLRDELRRTALDALGAAAHRQPPDRPTGKSRHPRPSASPRSPAANRARPRVRVPGAPAGDRSPADR